MYSHTARVRRRSLPALCLALVVPQLALASDPRSPLEIIDSGQGFRFEIALGVSRNSVSASSIYNRIAGTVVDVGAATARGVPVTRQLTLQQDVQGRTVVDINPFAPGQPPLPNGIYSQWIELRYAPGPEARSSAAMRHRHAFFFRVLNGTASRRTPDQYSALVDAPSQRVNKLGALEQVHLGTTAPRTGTTTAFTPAILVESGEGFPTTDNEQGQ